MSAAGRPLRALILNERDPWHPRAGGAEVHVREICVRLRSHGIESTLASCSFPGAPSAAEIDGLPIRRHGRIPVYYPRVAAACLRATRSGAFDLVVEPLNKLPFFAPVYARAPVIAVCHHLLAETAFLQAPWPVAAGVWLAEQSIPWAYRATPIVAVSESTRGDLVQRGLARERIEVIHNGIRAPATEGPPAGNRGPVMVYLGRLEPYKRVEIFLRVVRELQASIPGLEAWIIGRGTAEKRLRTLAAGLGVSGRVRFTGFVPDQKRDEILARARVCLCPSLREGWGITVIEANACGVPVVASRAPGLSEAVQEGTTGFLAEADSEAEFAEHARRLLTDDALANRLSAQARAWASRFSWDAAAAAMADAIRRACAIRA